jgi:ABC-type sulfate/molybdate transport systems ATPase subunit
MDAFDIAAICAHPDDAELIMGGTIARAVAVGRRVAMVDLTRGESGTRGTPETRAAEAAEAAKILGAAHRESLALPDGGLSALPDQKDVVVEALRRLRPRVVLLDEPFSALDGTASDSLLSRLQHWISEHRIQTVLVTHDATDAFATGAEVALLREGRLDALGPAAQALASERDRIIARL